MMESDIRVASYQLTWATVASHQVNRGLGILEAHIR